MSNTIRVPRLAKGKGYKGPEFYGCMNTGMAPAIFHSRCGKYYVGSEIPCYLDRVAAEYHAARVHRTPEQIAEEAAEEAFELRAAFGPGQRVVNILTGEESLT